MFNLESLLARLEEHKDAQIAWLVSQGYKVTKPRAPKAKAEVPKLNAIGKPYSPQFDPNYRMKYKGGVIPKASGRIVREHEYLAHMAQQHGNANWQPSWRQS